MSSTIEYTLEKIPEAVIKKCEYGKDDYRLNDVEEEQHEDEEAEE